jgi:hypothetical protein
MGGRSALSGGVEPGVRGAIVARQSAYWLLQLGSQSDTFTANGAALRFREFETVGNTPKGITSFVVNKSQS